MNGKLNTAHRVRWLWENFAIDFVKAIRKATSNTNSSWVATNVFPLINGKIIEEWAKWSVERLDDKPVTPASLLEACLGPQGKIRDASLRNGTPRLNEWQVQTAWGLHFANLREHVVLDTNSAGVLSMVLLNLSDDDWGYVAGYLA